MEWGKLGKVGGWVPRDQCSRTVISLDRQQWSCRGSSEPKTRNLECVRSRAVVASYEPQQPKTMTVGFLEPIRSIIGGAGFEHPKLFYC